MANSPEKKIKRIIRGQKKKRIKKILSGRRKGRSSKKDRFKSKDKREKHW